MRDGGYGPARPPLAVRYRYPGYGWSDHLEFRVPSECDLFCSVTLEAMLRSAEQSPAHAPPGRLGPLVGGISSPHRSSTYHCSTPLANLRGDGRLIGVAAGLRASSAHRGCWRRINKQRVADFLSSKAPLTDSLAGFVLVKHLMAMLGPRERQLDGCLGCLVSVGGVRLAAMDSGLRDRWRRALRLGRFG